VPEDVGFCVVLQNLKEHADALQKSPFAEQFARSELGKALRESDQLRALLEINKNVLGAMGLDAKSIADDVLSQAVVFAYRPGPADKPEQEEGIILIRGKSAEAVEDLIKRLNEFQKKSLKLEEREYEGIKYVRRVETMDTTFYCLRGPILIVTSQEAMLRRALDRERAKDEPILAQRLNDLGAEHAMWTFWLNPRAFDAAIEEKAAKAEPARAPALKTLAAYWKALDGLAVSIALEEDLAVSVAMKARTKQLPVAARQLLEEAAQPSVVWRVIPEDPLFAVGGRLNAALLLEVLDDFLTKESRDALRNDLNRYLGAPLGKDFVKEILPRFGPDWALFVMPPSPKAGTWAPEGVFAVRLGMGDKKDPPDEPVLSGLNALAMLAVVAINKQYPDQTTRLLPLKEGKVEGKYLSSDHGFPPGLQPTFGLSSGFLMLATSPDVFRRFAPDLGAGTAPKRDAPTPLLRISLETWRAYLKDHRAALVQMIAKQHNLDNDEAGSRLDSLRSGLEFFDRLEINQRSSAGQTILTFRVQTAQPLRK
jgi:hypothetical protein